MDMLLLILDIICLITFILFIKKLADIGYYEETSISKGDIWAYGLILTPIFSIVLIWISSVVRKKQLAEKYVKYCDGISNSLSEMCSITLSLSERIERLAEGPSNQPAR